jgi:PBP1b-binding outer membrane lipoprotein LpoB
MNKLFAIIAVFGLAFVFAGCPSSGSATGTKTEPTKTEPTKTEPTKTEPTKTA